MKPLVTVLMPVYNAEAHIREAIESILNQTYENFEFIIVNDGSSDGTEAIIEEYKEKDSRIVYVKNEKHKKNPESLNNGLDMAQGEYIARMDAEDISESDRLEKQVEYMEENKNCAVLGANFYNFTNEENDVPNIMPEENHDIKLQFLFSCPMETSTLMLRKSVLDENNLKYDPEYFDCEDFELLYRLKKIADFYNLQEFLVRKRKRELSDYAKNRYAMFSNQIYLAALKEIIDEDFYVSLYTKLSFNLPEIKESFNVLGEIPLMELKEDCPFTRKEISYACGMLMKNFLEKIDLPNYYLDVSENRSFLSFS